MTAKLTLGWLDGPRDGVEVGGVGRLEAEVGPEVGFIEGNPVGGTSFFCGGVHGLGHIGSVV